MDLNKSVVFRLERGRLSVLVSMPFSKLTLLILILLLLCHVDHLIPIAHQLGSTLLPSEYGSARALEYRHGNYMNSFR